MDFLNERYVRVYTRNTTTWLRLGWDAQCVLMQLLRVADRAGVIDIGDMQPWEAATVHCGAPEDVAKRGTARCLELGCVVHDGDRLVFPRFLEAQECAMTDAQRARESRARRAAVDRELSRNVTAPSQNVTAPTQNVSPASHAVTVSHTPSQPVTDGHSFRAFRAVPSEPSDQDQDRARALVVNAGDQDPPETDLRRGSDFMLQATGLSWQLCDKELALIGAKSEASRARALAGFRADPWAQANITRCDPKHFLRKWNYYEAGAPAEQRPTAVVDTPEVRTWRARVQDSTEKLSGLRKRRSELQRDHPDYLALAYDLDRQIREETERLERRTRELHALTG